jgi:hypothetical protein
MLDPDPGAQYTFQTFGDRKGEKDQRLTHIRHGSLEQHAAFLVKANLAGCGAFATVNAMDGKGRTSKNTVRVRGAFVDLDGAPLEPVLAGPLVPHIVVESGGPGRHHAYWLLSDCPIHQFTPIQRALAERFGGDRAVCDLPRVMRLPGFYHLKGDPRLTRLLPLGTDAAPYGTAEFMAAFAIGTHPPQPEARPEPVPTPGGCADPTLLARVRKIALDCALKTHGDPRLSRHTEIYRMGQYMRRDGLPFTGETIEAALGTFEANMRPANASGKVCGMDRCSATKALIAAPSSPHRPFTCASDIPPDFSLVPKPDAPASDALVGPLASASPAVREKAERIRSALAAIPLEAHLGGDEKRRPLPATIVLGRALKTEFKDGAEAVGLALCQEWDQRTGGTAAAAFERADPAFRGQPLTSSSVFALARANGWVGELGEKGENPASMRVAGQANGGEKRANFAPFAEYESPEYPVHALGPLKDVAQAIAREGQLDPATAAQSVLGVAALLAQGLANVQTLSGRKPLSLYLLSVMESGDGKSTAEGIALESIRKRERAEARRRREAAELAEVEPGRRKRGQHAQPETSPYRLMRDATIEGIRRSFAEGLPSQGAFTAEGALMLTGWGMNADNRAKTAGALNGLWDDGEISAMRALAGRIQLFNRRFSAHWLVQPEAAHEALHDPLLSGMGLWPRFLVAWPSPLKPRIARAWHWWDDRAVMDFWSRCGEMLAAPLGDEISNVPTIGHDQEAYALAAKFFEAMEREGRTATGRLREIKPFAVRATEQAFRIAGVLTAFEGGMRIGAERMRDGITLASYSLDTWRGIFDMRQESDHARWGRLLHGWMLKQADGIASETAMLKLATPKELRQRHRRDVALGWLQRSDAVERAGAPNTWRALPCS